MVILIFINKIKPKLEVGCDLNVITFFEKKLQGYNIDFYGVKSNIQ
jgi:hypothetical protein